MIDVHSHILPLVDDGSSSIEQSLTMLKEMESQGVTDVICTPHYGDEYLCEPDKLQTVFSELNREKEKQGIKVNIYLGQEILYDKKVKANLLNGKNIPLNGTPYVLVEFDYQREFKEKEKFKNCLFDICDLYIRVSDIPDKIRKEREMFERNKMKDLVKLTGYQKETLLNMAKLHGWKIGVDYVEPSMFDDNF